MSLPAHQFIDPSFQAQGSGIAERERGKVLLVKADREELRANCQALAGAGFAVQTAADAAACLDVLRDTLPDLILLGLELPDMGGEEVCERIRANPAALGVAIVHLAGHRPAVEEQISSMEAGADGYLPRDLPAHELIARVEAMLRARRTEAELRRVTGELRGVTRVLQQMIEHSLDIICSLDAHGLFTEVSAAAEKVWGYRRAELLGRSWMEFVHPEDRARTEAETRAVSAGRETRDFENRYVRKDGSTAHLMWSASWSPFEQTMFCVARDVTARKRSESFIVGQRSVLELIARGASLPATLEAVALLVEAQEPGVACSILELDATGRCLHTAAAPHLPAAYCRAIDGVRIGPEVGSCGAAAWHRKTMIAGDLSTHPAWRDFRALTSAHGLRACWSTPVISSDGRVLGTFAIYPDTCREPGSRQLDSMAAAAQLAGIAFERHRASRQLEHSRQRYRSLFAQHPDAVFSLDREGRFLSANAATERLSGSTAEELRGRHFHHLVGPGYHGQAEAQFARTVAGEAATSELRTLRRDGSERHSRVTTLPIVVDEEIVGVFGVSQDVSERHAQEMRLRESEERCREQAALLDFAQEAIVVQDLQGVILYWNKSAERIYGCGADEAIGQVFTPHAIGASAAHDAARREVLENGVWFGEFTECTPAGREIIVEAHWTVVRDAAERPKSILCINTDITERKRLETQFLRAQRLESIGTLAGGIAHDLNNVLAPIMLSIDLLKQRHPEPGTCDILETIETSARHGAEMVRQVLSFARGVEGQRLLVQPKYLLKEIQKIAHDTFPKNIALKIQAAPELWNVLGDPTQLHQVLLNLCVNARDAMPEGGSIVIAAENAVLDAHYAAMNIEARVGPHIILDVRDSGSGMSPAVFEKIFDPFFTTKELGKGTGLGLSSALAIVKSHGGFIRAYSEPGRGSSFKIHLPAQIGTAEIPVEVGAPCSPRGQGQTILIIDDEEAIRTITQRTLETFGYRTLLAADGAEGVTLFARHRAEIAAVVTDMMMPVMDGAATIQVLTRIDPHVKIIAASGMNVNGHPVRHEGATARYFLPKPYTADEMLQCLAAILKPDPASA